MLKGGGTSCLALMDAAWGHVLSCSEVGKVICCVMMAVRVLRRLGDAGSHCYTVPGDLLDLLHWSGM